MGAKLHLLRLPNIVSQMSAWHGVVRNEAHSTPSQRVASILADDLSGRSTTALGWVRLALSL